MSGSRIPGPAARALVVAALAVAAGSGGGTPVAEPALPATIVLRARGLHPGEPIRVEVTVEAPVAELGGEFLGSPISFARAGATGAGGEVWAGWSMIPLEHEPGPAAVEVRGSSASGRAIAGTRAVRVEPRDFPAEELSVEPRYVEPPAEVRERLAREREILDAVYALRGPGPPAGRPFVRPVSGEPTSAFGTRRLYNGKPRSPHPGLDLRAATGTPVHGSGDGRVALARDLYWSGITVILDHGGGLFTVYAHLSRLVVAEGDEVRAGQRIGLSGATGRVTGPHLHWGAKIADRPFDPAALLDARLFE